MAPTRDQADEQEDLDPVSRPTAVPWKLRLEDPFNRYYRYPVARLIVRALMKTPVTPNQVTLIQLCFAALAGWLITFEDSRYLLAGAVVFEIRSILDCADGTLARAKNMASPAGHAIDALADWLGVVFLYGGIFLHFHHYPPPPGPWSAFVSHNGILLVALFQGAVRSFSFDYFKQKYCSIFEQGCDETVDSLRRKVQALGPTSTVFAHADVFIGRMGHLSFEHEWFDAARSKSSTSEQQIRQLRREESSPATKLIAFVWSVSSGDAFLTMVIISLALNVLWPAQIFFATAGLLWIFGFIAVNGWFLRAATRRGLRTLTPNHSR